MPGAMPETLWIDGNADRFHTHVSSHWEFLQLWSGATFLEGFIDGLLHPQPDAAREALDRYLAFVADPRSGFIAAVDVMRVGVDGRDQRVVDRLRVHPHLRHATQLVVVGMAQA